MRWTLVLLAFAAGCKKDDGTADDTDDTDVSEVCYTLADGRCVEETFENPPVLQPDADGVYQLSLAATEVELAGERHCVRAYNGSYVGPTIETPARAGSAARSVRVDLANRMTGHRYVDLGGEECTCQDSTGAACLPAHVHDPCDADESDDCACTDEDGEACHMADFNVTNLHAHGSHVRPDYARGGEACEAGWDGEVVFECRECGPDVCDGDADDDACFHGDNVLNSVHYGSGARYRWDVDEDGTHHAGLQWYHPHIHGTTAIQVASGAAGAWIVRGEIDAVPGIAEAKERVMIFSTPPIGGDEGFEPLADGEACTDETLTFDSFETLGGTFDAQVNILNGMRQPRLITPPGQVERWRILHAGFLDEVFLGVFRGADGDCSDWSTADEDTLQLTQIGRDGIVMPQTWTDDYVFMSPGYRVEAMLGGDGTLEDGETWCLVAARFLQYTDGSDDPFAESPTSPMEPPTAAEVLARFDSDGDVVAILNVTASAGEATTTTPPDYAAVTALAPSMDLGGVDIADRCAEAATVTDPADIQQAAVLQVGFWTTDDPDPCDCEGYNVNCNNFEYTDRDRYPFDRDLPLDAIEHWRVQASFDGHPFHIHINPYVVCPQPNVFDPMPFPHWRDTYLVNVDRKIDLITQNRAFTGPYVFHCHKLTHEDHGMMEVIRVCDPEEDATCGQYSWRTCDDDDLHCLQGLAATDCALEAASTVEAGLCVGVLGGPAGICGENACVSDDDCANADACEDNVCVPAPCPSPCLPGDECVHGVCE